MLRATRLWVLLLGSCLLGSDGAARAEQPLPKVEIARRGKAATALVEVKDAGAYGTAFCIHPSGLFLTNEHVIDSIHESPISLVLHPGLKNEKVFSARVVRSDKKRDLALLQAVDARDLAALPLGNNDSLTELMEVVALGFPFGKALERESRSYPAISVSHGHVTALRHREGRLYRIQVDAVLHPGNSGGPVLDEFGKVVGVVVAGVRGAGVNFAIPVDDAFRFAYQTEVQLILPYLTRANRHEPALFKARATSAVPREKPLDLELTLSAGGAKDRKLKMEHVKGTYQVKAVPLIPVEGAQSFPLTVEYEKGSIRGQITDRPFKVGDRQLRLSEVSSIQLKPTPQASLADGTVARGPITGLQDLAVQIDDDRLPVNLSRVRSLRCEATPEVQTIICTVVARQDGKEVARAGDTITIQGVQVAESVPAGGPPAGPITPAALEEDTVTRSLPSTIGDVVAGGGGRYLILSLPKIRKLAIFDVSAARVVKYIPLEEETARFAAGKDKLIIVLPHKSIIQRWSLGSFTSERSIPLPVREQVTALAMGSASQGPVLVGTSTRCTFLDLETLRPLDIEMPEQRSTGLSERARVRASADGKVFGIWRGESYPQGLETFTLLGHQLHDQYEHQSVGHVTPGPDGKVLFTGHGLFSANLKPRKEDNEAGAAYCIPATQGPLYLSINTGGERQCALHMVGNTGPLVPRIGVDIPEGLVDGDGEALGSDRRLYLIPEARVIITIPISNDRLVLHRFDMRQALEKADVDYLLVLSQAPTVVKKGDSFTYALDVLSRKGGVTFRVDSGPKGMDISSKGVVHWKVPARIEESEVSIILVVGDRAGQEVFHTFTLSLRD